MSQSLGSDVFVQMKYRGYLDPKTQFKQGLLMNDEGKQLQIKKVFPETQNEQNEHRVWQTLHRWQYLTWTFVTCFLLSLLSLCILLESAERAKQAESVAFAFSFLTIRVSLPPA